MPISSGNAHRHPILLLLALMSIFWVRGLPAADGPTNTSVTADFMEMSLEELMAIPVYTASRRLQDVSEAPAFVTVITADSIRKYGYRTLADVLNGISGFYVSNDRNYQYVGVRGFSRPGDYNTRILLLLDGARMNENVYDSSGIGNDAVIDMDDIERIEIVRGPGSSLYGTSAFLGVINIIPRTGREMNGTEVSVEAGTHDMWKGRFSQGLTHPGGLNLYLSGSLYNSPGDRLYYSEFDSPGTHDGRTPPRADRDESERLYFNAVYKELFFQAGYTDRTKHIPTAPWGIVFADPRTRSEDSRLFADLRAEHVFSDRLTAAARVGYQQYNYDGWYVYDLGDMESPGTYINRDATRGEQWLSEASIRSTFFPRHTLTVGGEYRWNTRQDQKNYDEGSLEPWLNETRHSAIWAVYAQNEIRIHDRLLLNAGVRYDDYDSYNGKATPRTCLVFHPLDPTIFKLIYGRAFRAPNVYELYYNDQNETQKQNPDLKAENIDTWELVAEQRINRNLQITASLYDYHMDGLINQAVDPEDGLIFFDNIGHVHGQGAQLVLMGRFDNGVQGQASYSFVETEDCDTRMRLSNSPRNMAKLALSAPLASRQLFGSLECQFLDERVTLARKKTDAVWLANATVFHRNLVEGLETSLTLYNLLDQKYADPGAEEHVQDSIEQDGRTLRIKLTYRF